MATHDRYTKALGEWNARIGNAANQLQNWRLAAFAAISLSVILATGIVYQAMQTDIIPYIVEVDELGNTQGVEAVTAFNYNPTEASLKFFLSRFVKNIRSIPADPIVMRGQWLDSYHFVTANGNAALTKVVNQDKPFEKLLKVMRTAEIDNIIKMSGKTFQIRWYEEEFDSKGVRIGRKITYTGIFNVKLGTPKTKMSLLHNPMGIFIDSFNWTKDQGVK